MRYVHACIIMQTIPRNTSEPDLQDGFLVRLDQLGGIGDQMAKQASALFLVAAHAAVLQLGKDLTMTEASREGEKERRERDR